MAFQERFNERDWSKIEGWMSKEKGIRLQGMIKDIDAQKIVEVGVYGGASLIPMAQACRDKGSGVVHGIDPWQKDASTEGFSADDPNHKWWGNLDHSWVYGLYERDLQRYRVTDWVKTHIAYGDDVVSEFADESIDILHIDGNHSELCSTRDVQNWYPKVRKGGYIVFDDVNWASTRNAQNILTEKCGEPLELYESWGIWKK